MNPDNKSIEFVDHMDECPCYEDGQCLLQVTYNNHVSDPRYGPCDEHLCPVYFWIKIYSDLQTQENNNA